MWQSHILLRSETLLMCPQGPFQLAAPRSCSRGWKVPSTHLGMGLAQRQHLALGHSAEWSLLPTSNSLPPASVGLGTMTGWLSPEAELVCVCVSGRDP